MTIRPTTGQPVRTLVPTLTSMPVITLTLTPVSTPALMLTAPPQSSPVAPTLAPGGSLGTPMPDWEGVLIMPGAIEGRQAGWSYVYSVDVTVDEAEAFHMQQMEEGGWDLENRSTSDTSLFGGPMISLDFKRAGEFYNITLVNSVSSQVTIVILTRVTP